MSEGTQTGTLFVVATPIGNLEDITLRALRVLKGVDIIAAEDTRHTRKLLSHFDIHTSMTAFHEHSTEAERNRIVDRLIRGETVALVTDAGTPGISDPGEALLRDAVAAGVPITPIPGASAALTALVGSGLPLDRFRFCGFLPRKGPERKRAIADLRACGETTVLYESPNRVAKTVRDLAEALGARAACAARELTKIHEEFIRGPLVELADLLPDAPRGEWTLVIGGADTTPDEKNAVGDWQADLRARLAAGESRRDAVRAVSESFQVNRKEVYAESLRDE
ncbi:MAG TPA: 16S rRNA (cytidine(1402)-2'-O)-methyltransferase [Armatimonadota bacterium]|jgi:16S rRNA (cytidine1402-2'-O)-methyltransferase